MLSRQHVRPLIGGGVVALFLSCMLAMANGSHISASFQNGFSFEFKLGATTNALVDLLGILGVIAVGAGVVTWFQHPDSSNESAAVLPSQGPTAWERLRHLTLSKTDCQLCGVCGGLGEHTLIPAWMWRVGFCSLTFWLGTGLAAYIILWICIPNPPEPPEGEKASK